jgi:hypothetical protein
MLILVIQTVTHAPRVVVRHSHIGVETNRDTSSQAPLVEERALPGSGILRERAEPRK